MPHYVVDQLAREPRRARRPRPARRENPDVGVAYKKNVEDIRESPAFKLIELLEERGAAADFYDPHVPQFH